MKTLEVVRAWGGILSGRKPSLSIEITRECPLRCPGCYAYDDNHLGGDITLRQLSDYKGDALIAGVLELVDRYRPLHLSIVGGDPLVRYREVEALIPQIIARGVHVQLVTSAFRPLAEEWKTMNHLNIVVSIDGLQPEHDVRRKPATYERILKSVSGHRITVHCTITAQMMHQRGYLEDFLEFWSARPEVRKVWFSIFTPQIGDSYPEILSPEQRVRVISELLAFREHYPKLDMPKGMIEEFSRPPKSPAACIFAQTTRTISADLKTAITPCQFGGKPDCSQCGCIASMGLAAVGNYRLGGFIPVGKIFWASARIGSSIGRKESAAEPVKLPVLG